MKRKFLVASSLLGILFLVGCSNQEISKYVNEKVESVVTSTEEEVEEIETEQEFVSYVDYTDILKVKYIFPYRNSIVTGCAYYIESEYTEHSLELTTPDFKASYMLTITDKTLEEIQKNYKEQGYDQDWTSLNLKDGTFCFMLTEKEQDTNISIYIWMLNNGNSCIFTSCVDDDSPDGNIIKTQLLNNMTDITK